MPKRTNRFQKLVCLFKQQLSGEATVTESKELLDRVTGEKVEVDICIETTVGGDSVIIGVECTKRGRKATLGWVNEMLAKHESLPTNLLVLASHSGFVKNAKKKAESKGAKLIYLSTVSEATVRSAIGEIKSISLTVWEISTDDIRVRLAPIGEHPRLTLSVKHDYCVFLSDGSQAGALSGLVNALLESPHFLKEYRGKTTDGKKGYEIEWTPSHDGQPFYLQSERAMHPIERIRIIGAFEIRESPMKVQNQSFGGFQIAWAEGKSPFHNHDVVALKTTDAHGNEMFSSAFGSVFSPPHKLDVQGTRGQSIKGGNPSDKSYGGS